MLVRGLMFDKGLIDKGSCQRVDVRPRLDV